MEVLLEGPTAVSIETKRKGNGTHQADLQIAMGQAA
jgi:hypothetical protein